MKRKQSKQKRSQSLKLYKPTTLELPRFYSKQKNSPSNYIKNGNIDSECSSSKKSSKQEKVSLNKNKIAEIVDKIKQEKQQLVDHRNQRQRNYRQKKITAYNVPSSYKNAQSKANNKYDRNNSDYESIYGSKIGGQSAHRRKLTTDKSQKNNDGNLSEGLKQLRSKSLKNAIKLGNSQQIRQSHQQRKVQWKTERNKKIATQNIYQVNKIDSLRQKNHIKSKRIIQQKNRFGEDIIHAQKQINKQILDIPTEDTQYSFQFSDIQKNMWNRTVQIFQKICRNLRKLQWSEQFIVMEKFHLQKKLFDFFREYKQLKIKDKFKKHICITRVIIYMHANLIVNQMDTQFLGPVLQNIKNSYIKILEAVHRICQTKTISPQINLILNKNNQSNLKHLQKILIKKSIPFRNLLQNMLQSSLKIQSFEFIQILDKTLKWQLLKMPSFPYLPPTQKQMFLVLDLDQTLIHYSYDQQVFHIRPFTQQFLKKISQKFEVTIFTAAIQQYADQIISQIDPQHSVSYKLYRNHLTYLNGFAIKDLSMLGRPLNKTIIVDNISNNYRLQPQNGIQIRSWYNQDEDDILGKLYALLIKIAENHSDDFRNGIRQYGDFIREQITKSELIYELQNQL